MRKSGYTLIEVLVVTALLAMFTTFLVVSFQNTSRYTRDARRKKDMAQLQAALEIYKQANDGVYPDHTPCNSTATWPGCMSPWIPGMTDDYMPTLPVDPKENTTSFIANTPGEFYTYNYIRVTPITYQIITRLENTQDEVINGSAFGYSGDGIYVLTQPK